MWGGGDQGRVNMPILRDLGCDVIAIVDDTPDMKSAFPDIPLLFGWTGLSSWLAGVQPEEISQLGFVIAIGNPYVV